MGAEGFIAGRAGALGGGAMKSVDIISPVFREEASIDAFHEALSSALAPLSTRYRFRIIYVLDPSPDNTEQKLKQIADRDPRVVALVSARRFGHQAALIAGIDYSDADAIVMLDSDLQHPPALIPEMIARWEEGAEIVQTLRRDGAETAVAKRTTSRWFYDLLKRTSSIGLEPGAADFRLLTRAVADRFKTEIREHNPFLRGLVSWVGHRIVYLPFTPAKRFGGRSNYSASALFSFAVNGLCSFSKLPLRLCIGAGLAIAALSMIVGLITVGLYIAGDRSVPGWASLFTVTIFATGINLFFLGVIGEYVGLIFDEVKNRPRYLISHQHAQTAASDVSAQLRAQTKVDA